LKPLDPKTQSSRVPDLGTLSSGFIEAVDGPDRGKRTAVSEVPVVVGSASTCDLVLTDSKVSRRHCEISLKKRGFWVRDLQSTNGTYFEGAAVSEVALLPGMMVKLGQTHLVLGVDGVAMRPSPSQRRSFGSLWGKSLVMRRTFALLERAVATAAPVLLLGESGTGKDLAARALHEQGARARSPFEIMDIGATPLTLLQSELFGHCKDAFTGASRDRPGAAERAHGGTLFLDEIGELAAEHQPAFLRLCDRGEVRRIGEERLRRVDVRLIAATCRDLPAEVAAGRFREDLYHRLAVLTVTMPPLRARLEDVPGLCEVLLRELGMSEPGPIEGEGLKRLLSHAWVGNVRELRNALQRALVQPGPRSCFADLEFDLRDAAGRAPAGVEHASFQERKRDSIARFEREYLQTLLREQGSVKGASRSSGIERSQLKRLLKKHRLI
jgi:DNA-binding NtrC family response regulator